MRGKHLRNPRDLRAQMSEWCLLRASGTHGVCVFPHADDADLPYGCERDNNVPVARMAQMGEKGKDEKIKGDSM